MSTPHDPLLEGLKPADLLKRGLETVKAPSGTPQDWQPPEPEMLAQLLPQYQIEALLGRGGMGAVYRGKQAALDRAVAIKLLPAELTADAEFVGRFQREARTLARMQHPGIVSVYDFGQTSQGHLYFVMEYVDGTDLHRIIQGPGLNPAQVLEIVAQVCEALQYAHSQGVMHRDIKPANVLLTQDGRAKLADFGLARPTQEDSGSFTRSNVVMGTPDYIAPEQLYGQADHRADLFSLGVMLYEMLTGQTPRGAWSLPSQRVRVDVRLDQVVLRALQQDVSLRYQQASEMKTDVDQIRFTPPAAPKAPPAAAAAPPVAAARQASERPASPLPKRKKKVSFMTVAAIVLPLLAAGGGGWWLTQPPDSAPPDTAAAESVSTKKEQQMAIDPPGPPSKTSATSALSSPPSPVTPPPASVAQTTEPAPAASPAAAVIKGSAWRVAAEWALTLKGKVEIETAGKRTLLEHPDQIPAGKFEILAIEFSRYWEHDGKKMNETDLTLLNPIAQGLERLILDNCAIKGGGLEAIAGATKLKRLSLYGTNVTDDTLKLLTGLLELEDLALGETPVTGAGFIHLQGLPKLKILSIHGPALSEQGGQTLAMLSKLESLEVECNGFIGEGLALTKHFATMTQLRRFTFGNGSQVDDRCLEPLKNFSRLEKVNFGNSKISGTGFVHLKNSAPTLKTVFMYAVCPITNEGVETIVSALPNLECLHIGHGAVCGPDALRTLARLPRLKELQWASRGAISAAEFALFSDLPALDRLWILDRKTLDPASLEVIAKNKRVTWLALNFTSANDAGLQKLESMKSLRHLQVRSSQVTDAGLAAFKKARPDVKVVK